MVWSTGKAPATAFYSQGNFTLNNSTPQIPPFKIQTPLKLRPFHPNHNDYRAVVVGNSGISYQLPGAPFEFMYSYSETPRAQPLAIREPAFLPFAPPTMPRPWTGKAPVKKSKRNIKLFEPLGGGGGDENPNENLWSKKYEMLRGYEMGKFNVSRGRRCWGRRWRGRRWGRWWNPCCLVTNRWI